MDVTVVLERYRPWTTLFTPCVDLSFPKNRTLSFKKKKVKVTPPKKEVKEKKRKEKKRKVKKEKIKVKKRRR